ncbi:LAMI_0D06106g1_1 [Lachancea mirantina]|uniref:tRNA-splicing endonuclease subunit Sen34 n=1 Tax=Lachancea mirantina TaxID=1230905 RepID=A0A1G4JBM7_9SACH|nr:LAMI_0D06106g1_1 [Lachancea mirantina]
MEALEGENDSKIEISVVGNGNRFEDGVCLVFDIESIRRLRRLGITGILTGTLPSAAQQNVFLTVPLRLMAEEAVWLVENGFAVLVSDREALEMGVSDLTASDWDEMDKQQEALFEEQRRFKREQHFEKLRAVGKTVANVDANLESSLFVETRNESSVIQRQRYDFDTPELQKRLVDQLLHSETLKSNYLVYKALRAQGYCVSPGSRFGGRYIAYPGDPLRYHSHLTVPPALRYRDEPLDLLQLVGGGRLGTGVKKLWVLGGVDDESDEGVTFFSVEWAGFG